MRFINTDLENAYRLIESTQYLISELLPAAIEDQDFDGCVEIAATIISNCKDLKRMEHPEQVVRLHEIASKFASRGLNVSAVGRPFQ
ncbi:YqaH family protein [Bacillus glycinifermentans]|uniref:YqaH family protein n=1 Tax=Bacillus glycinifermentans TaxID=1664069 RepID=UPI002DB6B6E7|nr:YqaH family protein [Bacillus glycinifermentans]MEC0543474.1 YqaH family protein [Bacillus glycinifermentans]